MRKDNRTNILFRYGIIVALILLLSSMIVYKLVDTTVLSAAEWNKKAAEELSKTYTIVPERGNILAADGSVLAANLRFYTIRIDYRADKFREQLYRDSMARICDSMARYFPKRTAQEWNDYLMKPLQKPKEKRSRFYPILINATYEQVQRLRTFPFFNIKNPVKNGLVEESYLRRVNPYGNMARRSIGGVGKTSECDEVHGISGIESALDSLLYGKPGVAKLMPVTSDYVNWTDVPAVPGYDIKTTIDINMQDIVENELNRMLEWVDADWGVAVLMRVETGDICAISNLEKSPSGNGYIEGRNRAVTGYEPGSVVKPISMLIALEEGIVRDPNEYITTGHKWRYAGSDITDDHPVDGLRVEEVIERSSNIGMARIITRRYNDNPGGFYSALKKIGFLDPMHTGIAGEMPPHVDSLHNDNIGRIALSRQCYGYATHIPPLYTLSVYNAIANGGKYVRPRLVTELIREGVDSVLPVTYVRPRICSEHNAELLRRMLRRVVWGDHGTARHFVQNDLVEIAGKTGTCYMIEDGKYNKAKKRLSFCGFFPADQPKYSCIVLTAAPKRNAMGAASTSGTVLKNIALRMYARGYLGRLGNIHNEREVNTNNTPLFVADANRAEAIQKKLGIGGQSRVVATPAVNNNKGVVPDVRGMSPRQAVKRLEEAGFNVVIEGVGSVAGQIPAANTKATPGTRVRLMLRI